MLRSEQFTSDMCDGSYKDEGTTTIRLTNTSKSGCKSRS